MNDHVQTQELAPEDDPKNYEPRREDGRPDLTFCETFFGYPEDILADILRKENVSETIIAKIESDEPHSITEEERTEIENSVTTAEETGKVPADLRAMARYNLVLPPHNFGEEALKKLVGYDFAETNAALFEFRNSRRLSVDPKIIIFPERFTAIEKAKLRTILFLHYRDYKPELFDEYTTGEVVGDGFRRVPIWARAIFEEAGIEEKGNWNKMPITDYAWLMSELSRIIPGFDVPLTREEVIASGMDMDADVIGEDEDPIADMAEDLKNNIGEEDYDDEEPF